MTKLSVQNIFGPKSRPALDKSKTRRDIDYFGYHNLRSEAAVYRVKEIKSLVNYWDDDRFMTSLKNSLALRAQAISLSNDDL